jgi:hypothetical protein
MSCTPTVFILDGRVDEKIPGSRYHPGLLPFARKLTRRVFPLLFVIALLSFSPNSLDVHHCKDFTRAADFYASVFARPCTLS